MATRLHFRSTTGNVDGLARTELSTTLPVGTLDDSGGAARDLLRAVGSSQTTQANTSLAQTGQQSQYYGKWISAPVDGTNQINSGNWTVALAGLEGNGAANAFFRVSIYVITSGGTVRGFIYDGTADLSTELATSNEGRVATVAGSQVASVVSTDRIVCEVWMVASQQMATAYNNSFAFDGATAPQDGVATSDAASYIETAQNGIFAPRVSTVTIADAGRAFPEDAGGPYQDLTIVFEEAMTKLSGDYTQGNTILGLTCAINGGSAQALTYRSGEGTATWVVRTANLIQQDDTVTLTYDRSVGELVATSDSSELRDNTDNVTNNLTKRIRATLKRGDTGAVITTAVDMLVLDAEPRDSDDANWGAVLQRHPNVTPNASGIVDVQATDASLAVGDPVYLIVVNPREDATGGATTMARSAFAVVTVQ